MRRLGLLLFVAGCSSPSIREIEHSRIADSSILRDATRSKPAEAARAMGRIQSPGYLNDLIALLGVPEASEEAIFAIGQLALGEEWDGSQSEKAAKALLPLYASHPAAVVEALGKLKRDVPLEALAHSDSAVRQQGALAIFRAYPKDKSDDVVKALVQAANDPDEEVRWRVAYALSRPPEPRALAALQRLAADTNAWARLFAARGLGGLKSSDPQILEKLCLDVEALVRIEAIDALAKLERGASVPRELLRDRSPHVRAAAVVALGEPLLDDASSTVRGESLVVVGKKSKGSPIPGSIAAAAKDPDWRIRAKAAEASGEVGSLEPRLLEDSDDRVRAAAVDALGQIGGDGTFPLVVRALDDPKIAVKGSAIDALKNRKDARAVPALTACYEKSMGRDQVELREMLADALSAFEGTSEFLGRIADRDPAPSVRAVAAKALKRPVPRADRKPDRPELLRKRFESDPVVVFETSKGVMEVQCFPADAPVHVANFIQLVQQRFYDGKTFHRVVPNFVIQGGDPLGNGWGDAGYSIADEINRIPYERGTLGMPKAGKDTGSCQLFITHLPTPHLDGRYTVFGQVISGLEVIDKIEVGDTIMRARLK